MSVSIKWLHNGTLKDLDVRDPNVAGKHFNWVFWRAASFLHDHVFVGGTVTHQELIEVAQHEHLVGSGDPNAAGMTQDLGTDYTIIPEQNAFWERVDENNHIIRTPDEYRNMVRRILYAHER